jgi:undecaprenyl diphosphate synthase
MTTHHIPESIGIIMDGNRRFAKEQGLPSLEGHRRGYEKLVEVLGWCRESGVKELIVFAFSTENWQRAEEEVGYLMNLFRTMIANVVADAKQNDTRLIFLGERVRFAPDIRAAIERAEEETKGGRGFTFGIALSYGGRTEIMDAIRRIPPEKLATLTEEEFSGYLWTKEMRDPDLILRTSGEERLSGFLPWQGVYSELFFTPTYWPAFSRTEFDAMLETYTNRQRRFGK